MNHFPQLSSGATGQFPIRRQRVARTVTNQSAQDYQVRLADSGAAMTEWHLSFEEMSDQELAAVAALFQTVEGRLTPFTFLDPADNLLAWSEQQNQPAWQADPILILTGGEADPFGGTGAYQLTNPSAATLTLQQTINAPAALDYCLSLYARSDQSARIWLRRGSESEARTIDTVWTRPVSGGRLQSTADFISFGIGLNPGSTVSVFGMQGSASGYKKTAETGGVYANARFRDDALAITTLGPNRHSCELDIVNVEYL